MGKPLDRPPWTELGIAAAVLGDGVDWMLKAWAARERGSVDEQAERVGGEEAPREGLGRPGVCGPKASVGTTGLVVDGSIVLVARGGAAERVGPRRGRPLHAARGGGLGGRGQGPGAVSKVDQELGRR